MKQLVASKQNMPRVSTRKRERDEMRRDEQSICRIIVWRYCGCWWLLLLGVMFSDKCTVTVTVTVIVSVGNSNLNFEIVTKDRLARGAEWKQEYSRASERALHSGARLELCCSLGDKKEQNENENENGNEHNNWNKYNESNLGGYKEGNKEIFRLDINCKSNRYSVSLVCKFLLLG